MKSILTVLFFVCLAVFFVASLNTPVSAQGIGVPLATAILYYIPTAPPYPASAVPQPWPPTLPPQTATYVPTIDLSVRRAYVQAPTILYQYNKLTGRFGRFAPIATTRVGDTFAFRVNLEVYGWPGTWAQCIDPLSWYNGMYIEQTALKLL